MEFITDYHIDFRDSFSEGNRWLSQSSWSLG